MSTVRRTPVRVVLAAVIAAAFAGLTVGPAHAAAYRFWGFYQLDAKGAWAFAQKGSDDTVPKDGTVEGWRFAVSDEQSTRYPRATPSFEQICATTPAKAGNKRVGLVVDFGRAADAEDGATPPEPKVVCAVVTTDSTSTDVLRTAGDLRSDKGLVCAVAGYPATGCGGAVKEVSAAAKAADTPVQVALPSATPSATAAPAAAPAASTSTGSNTAAYVVAGLAVLALIGYLVLRARRKDASAA